MMAAQMKGARVAGLAVISAAVLVSTVALLGAPTGSGEGWEIHSESESRQKTDTVGGMTTESSSASVHSRQCSNQGRAIADTQTIEVNPDHSAHDHESISYWENDDSTMTLHRDNHRNPDGTSSRRSTESTTTKDGYRETYTKDEEFDSQGHRTKVEEHITPERVDPKARLGAQIPTPCSCQGNWCAEWPVGPTFGHGYRWQRDTVSSTVVSPGNGTVGGAYVAEQWQGGSCMRLGTDKPAQSSFTGTDSGTYVLTIRNQKLSGVADCNHPTCATVSTTTSDLTEEKRYFTVENRPQCGQ
jgi:hypothetical protein